MISTEYLCKAKRTDNKEWIVGYLFRLSENHPPFIMLSNSCGESHEVDEPSICRCVGIEDKTGNLVWENDIIEKEFYTDYNAYANSEKYSGVVRWSSLLAWEIETERGNRLLTHELEFTDFKNHCKVVGNVFDNPELLKEIGIEKEPDIEEMER